MQEMSEERHQARGAFLTRVTGEDGDDRGGIGADADQMQESSQRAQKVVNADARG